MKILRAHYAAAIPLRAGRRVPGHQPAAVPLAELFRLTGVVLFFAVGDDDQSIYTFRGANVGNMAEFEREFAIKRVVRLEQNYRSHGNILDAANALIANNRNRLGKNLWTSSGPGEPVRVFEGESDMDEARWLVEEVRASVARRHGALRGWPSSTAPTPNRASWSTRFSAPTMPYRVYGGLRFFERAGGRSTRSPTCGLRRHAFGRHELPARCQLPAARHRCALHGAVAGRGEATRGSSV